MVNIQPGQLAATMTAGPGNNLYMPPETVQEEGATRYNTTIDIFSFGVVSLFTLTQTFPKDLKPATYLDPLSQRIVGRSEIERREHYIQLMQAALGETHLLVKLTLDSLAFAAQQRPSAVEVLRQLEEFGRTVPQNCTETKLELIQQISQKEEMIKQIQTEQLAKKKLANDRLQVEKDEKEKQIDELKKPTASQQKQLDIQKKEIERLSKLRPQEEGS